MPLGKSESSRRSTVLRRTMILAGMVTSVALAVACRGGGQINSSETSVKSTPATILPASGTLDDLQTDAAKVGDEMTLTGRDWMRGETVRFYLLTKEQSDSLFDPEQVISLGNIQAQEDGTVSFKFRLQNRYDTPGGERREIEVGQQWYIQAFQSIGQGSHGVGVGPLRVI